MISLSAAQNVLWVKVFLVINLLIACHVNEYRCANFECVNATLRCNGVRDCADGSDEYECVRSDTRGVVQVYDAHAGTWSVLCAKSSFDTVDADHLCHNFGYWRSVNYTLLAVTPEGNSSWALGLPYDRIDVNTTLHSPVCDTNLTVSLACEQYECGLNQRGVDLTDNRTVLKQSSEDVPSGATIVTGNTRATQRECAAQIIATKWLIASAQCVVNFSLSESFVRLSNTSEAMNISRIVIHPKYSKFRSLRVPDYDLALIETSAALNVSDSPTVCLPQHEIDADITCFVGTSDTGGDIPYEVIEKRVCNSSQHFNASLTARHFCANVKNSQPGGAPFAANAANRNRNCVPNGSPLICLSSMSRWYVAGFSSYQHGCNGSTFITHPTIFSSVYNMKPFIDQVIGINQYRVDTGDDTGYFDALDVDGLNSTNATTTVAAEEIRLDFTNGTQTNISIYDSTVSNSSAEEISNSSLIAANMTDTDNTTTTSIDYSFETVRNYTVDSLDNGQSISIEVAPTLTTLINSSDTEVTPQPIPAVNETTEQPELEEEPEEESDEHLESHTSPESNDTDESTESPDTTEATEPSHYSDDTTEPSHYESDETTESPETSESHDSDESGETHASDDESTESPESDSESSEESSESEEPESETRDLDHHSSESESDESDNSTEAYELETTTELPTANQTLDINQELSANVTNTTTITPTSSN